MTRRSPLWTGIGVLTIAVGLQAPVACTQVPDSRQEPALDELIRTWDGRSGAELLAAMSREHPTSTAEAKSVALDPVARGPYSARSVCAAEALCRLSGLGDPCETANQLYNESERELTEPQWFLWVAGYSYNWICNSGLSACYFEFDERQFADRVRVYQAIGARKTADVLREADLAFGPEGPPASLEGRRAAITDTLYERLNELSPRLWDCSDEIFTQAYLYALEHAEDFRVEAAQD